MNKKICFCSIICICLILAPTMVHATDSPSKYFTIGMTAGGTHGEPLYPGETFSDSIYITNTSKNNVSIRLNKVENLDSSKLYSAMEARWITPGEETPYVALSEFSSGWFTLAPKQTKKMDVDLLFSIDSGNEFQGASLEARLIFEAQVPDEIPNPDGTPDKDAPILKDDDVVISWVPKSGDRALYSPTWFALAIVSGAYLIFSLFCSRKVKK